MEWYHLLGINLTLLVIFFCMGMPISIAFFSVNILSLTILMGPKGLLLLINSMLETTTSFTLAAIPLFVLVGNILYQSNAVEIMFEAVDKWVGSVRARLHIVTVIIAAIFSAISGAAMGTVTMLGTTIFPEMNRRGYDRKLSIGAICAGANLDPIIPPSILAIVVGTLANVSIAKLLISGIIPGIILASVFIIYILIRVRLNPDLTPPYDVAKIRLSQKIWALIRFLPFGVIIFLVVGLIMLGIATPTESAATGVIGSLIIAALYRRLTYEAIKDSVFTTAKISGMILVIMASAQSFSQIMALSGAAQGLVNIINTISVPAMVMFTIMNLIPLFLCCFMDQTSLMMILVPIYIPIVNLYHFDPIWFWLIMLINITIGGITPPFGYVLFAFKATSDEITLQEVYRAIIPFVFLYLLGMLLVVLFPPIATWLPGKL